MPDNTIIKSPDGGNVIRTIDNNGAKTPVIQIDAGGTTSESLVTPGTFAASPAVGIPVQALKDAGRTTVNYYTLTPYQSSVTVTSATPGVVTWTAHGLVTGTPVQFSATTIPTGITAGAVYYVLNEATNTFQISTTPGGGAVATTSTGTAVVCSHVYSSANDIAIPLYGFRGTASVARSTSQTITTGKTYRVTAITLSFFPQAGTTPVSYIGRLSLRYNSAGAATAASPAVGQWMIGGKANVLGLGVNTVHVPFIDGLDLAGGGFCLTYQQYDVLGATTSIGSATSPAGKYAANIYGYEY